MTTYLGAYPSYDDWKTNPDYMQAWSEVIDEDEDEDHAYDSWVDEQVS